MNKSKRIYLLILCAALALEMFQCRAHAGGFYQNPNITLSPDKKAWTVKEDLPENTNPQNWVNPACWYPEGTEILTGIESSLNKPKTGEHLYRYKRKGIVPVSKWEVVYRTARCIHPDYPVFHGMQFTSSICSGCYYSGWNAWCADCGETLDSGYVYMSKKKIRTMKEIDLNLDYYYGCPSCGHLEQGRSIFHECKGVSANRYRVVYHANAGDASGSVRPSFHMYNNSVLYEGKEVTPVKKLSKNNFTRTGYCFLGWNTKPGGNGKTYQDGQEIWNLTSENYDAESGKGTVDLYAQWKKVNGTLTVDPGKGQYQGKSGISEYKIGYEEKLRVRSRDVTPPEGFLVSFDTMGGKEIKSVREKIHFSEWKLEEPARGVLTGEVYQYLGKNGQRDRISAMYQEEGIVLPEPVKKGYSFEGWYLDRECRVPAGKAGDLYSPVSDITLYAHWVDLVLSAKVNLKENAGKGAVDLKWSQPDGNRKVYLVYQKRKGEEYTRVYESGDESMSLNTVRFTYCGREESYQVPASGFYELEISAKGQDAFQGAGVSADWDVKTFYLEKGDLLTIRVNLQDPHEIENGNKTEILSQNRGILLRAGEGVSSGERNRDGYASVRPVNVGFHDAKKLIGTEAVDLRAPNKIDVGGIKKEAAENGKIRLSFTAPEDKGTVYYHQVKSYQKGSEKLLCVSNITCTEVITGVAGYYYRIDGEQEAEVTSANADNKKKLLTMPSLVINLLDKTQYLHLAAVDRAGNVGKTLTVRIMPEDIDVAWKLHTEQMRADSILGDQDYGSVVSAGEKAYYVRADGETPFLLKYAGSMEGIPRKNYQIDRAGFDFRLSDLRTQGRYTVLLAPGRLSETEETDACQWERQFSGRDILQPAMYGKALRTNKGRRLEICHSFTLDQKYHGKTILVSPMVGAAFGDGIEFSSEEEDASNGIALIGDGKAPQINGMKDLEELLSGDRDREKKPVLDLSAEDELSGVESFYAVLRNVDNNSETSCYPDEDGHIRIDLSEDNPLLLGNLKLTVYARDRVGNERIVEEGAAVFGLSARIEKMLPPYLPEFKRGESGWLKVTVWGYAERLEIQFPEEFTSADPSLDQIFEYAIPEESRKEEIAFMVPLYLEKSKEYQITVRAFKGDGMLERHPVLCTLHVEDTVLDEIRTRLR